jgi:hypothetical protein
LKEKKQVNFYWIFGKRNKREDEKYVFTVIRERDEGGVLIGNVSQLKGVIRKQNQ